MAQAWRRCHGCACGRLGIAPCSCAVRLRAGMVSPFRAGWPDPLFCLAIRYGRRSGSPQTRRYRARSSAAPLGNCPGRPAVATRPPLRAAAELKTRAAPSRGGRVRPQTQGPMTDAASRLACNAHTPRRRGFTAKGGDAVHGAAPVVLQLRTDQPSTPPASRRPCRANARSVAAHRSSRLNDQAHADRRHPRGRNPRGGAGR